MTVRLQRRRMRIMRTLELSQQERQHIRPLRRLQQIGAIACEPLSGFIASQSFLCRLQLLQHFGSGQTPKGQRALVHTVFLTISADFVFESAVEFCRTLPIRDSINGCNATYKHIGVDSNRGKGARCEGSRGSSPPLRYRNAESSWRSLCSLRLACGERLILSRRCTGCVGMQCFQHLDHAYPLAQVNGVLALSLALLADLC